MDVFKEILKVLNFNGSEMIVQIVNFLILLVILRIFFWKPVLKLLDERKQKIADEQQKAENLRKDTELLKDQFEAKLNSIEAQAKAMIQEAEAKAKQRAEEIQAKARQEAQKAIECGSAEIQFQIAKAKEELKQQTIEFTMQAAEQLVEKKFTADDDKKLVAEFINGINRMTVG
jgi:F-type H+-transporting ATPase subunit b